MHVTNKLVQSSVSVLLVPWAFCVIYMSVCVCVCVSVKCITIYVSMKFSVSFLCSFIRVFCLLVYQVTPWPFDHSVYFHTLLLYLYYLSNNANKSDLLLNSSYNAKHKTIATIWCECSKHDTLNLGSELFLDTKQQLHLLLLFVAFIYLQFGACLN